jgi:hypothetical protein
MANSVLTFSLLSTTAHIPAIQGLRRQFIGSAEMRAELSASGWSQEIGTDEFIEVKRRKAEEALSQL